MLTEIHSPAIDCMAETDRNIDSYQGSCVDIEWIDDMSTQSDDVTFLHVLAVVLVLIVGTQYLKNTRKTTVKLHSLLDINDMTAR